MSAIYDLMHQVKEYGALGAEYWEKMMHRVPEAQVLEREKYILEACRGKVVLDIGGTGPLAEALPRVAKEYHALDRVERAGVTHFYQVDIDQAERLPEIAGVEIVVAGEIIEHLSNAGHFLDLLHAYKCPVILTTVNAFNDVGYRYMSERMIECVNQEHVAYYSYWTLKTLVERHRWKVEEWYWYKGKKGIAEGMIFNLTPSPFPNREGEKEGGQDA